MTQLRSTILALGIIALVMMTMIPMQAIAKDNEIELNTKQQEGYDNMKENLYQAILKQEKIVTTLGIEGIKELLDEVMAEPYIIKQYKEWQEQTPEQGVTIGDMMRGLDELKLLILNEMQHRTVGKLLSDYS